ncbi:autotransporter domain-containing protein [Methylophilaceae bacterium]|nr:autotransporter domain-containing protein [Methylophilaceae bacterium]
MKKTLLALATTLLLPNMSYAAACADGANAAGCTIGTTGFDYTLTGDIAPASGVVGIKFTSGATTNTTTLTGDISTTGDYAYGLHLTISVSNTTTLTGDISTTGDYAYGLYLLRSDSNTTTLTGDISVAKGYGVIIQESDFNNTAITGDITGDSADGLYLYNSYSNTTTVNGDISVAKGYGVIIQESDFNNTAITGDITAGGDYATGAYLLDSHSNTLTLGNISADSTLAGAGVWLEASDSNEIIINGRVSGSGEADAIRVQNTSDSNTITLNQGGSIIGNIVNDATNNTLNFNLGRAASYNFTTSGSVDWILNDTTKTVIAGSAKSRGVADMDDAGNRLYQRLSQINSSLTNQQRQTRQGQARGDYWIDSYYTDSERDTSPAQINQHTRGITVGFNASGDRDLAMDVIINYENSDAGYGLSEQTVDSNSLMVGLSFPELMTAMDGSLAVKFLAGMSDNDRDLTVLNNTVTSGQEIVTDSYDSTYVTAGASWMQSLYATQRFHHNVLVGMDINHEQIEGSTASSYYALADRDITQLVGQAQYGITIQGMNKKLTINGNIGLTHANIIDGEKQHYTIDGTAVSYTADNSNTYTTASLGATYQLNPQAYAYANVKQFDSTDDIDGTTGKVGLVVSF